MEELKNRKCLTQQPNEKNPMKKMDKGSEQTFLQGRYTNDQQTHEEMFNIINHRGMQIKTTMRYHFIPTRRVIIKTKQTNKNRKYQELVKMWRNGNPYILLVRMQNVAVQQRAVWQFLKKLNVKLPYDPAVPLLGIHLKELKTDTQIKCLHMNVSSSTNHNSLNVETTQMGKSID